MQIFVFSALYVYLGAVVSLVFFPFPFQQSYLEHLRSLPYQPQNNIVPFKEIIQIWEYDTGLDFLKQIGGNILMLCPFGFLVPLVLQRPKFSKVLLLGFLFSVLLETAQLVLDTIINYNYRTADVDDLICNTLGVLVGYLAWRLLEKPFSLTSMMGREIRS